MDNNNQTSKHLTNAGISDSETRLSSLSSSSSESSTDTIDKEQLIIETKQVLVSASENNSINHPNSSITSSPTNPNNVQGGIYDPNRIPTSVFTSKPGTPIEWSVASNESLFSIHMGNNSFSRDHTFMLYRSGEFPRLDLDQPMNSFSGSNTPPITLDNSERTSEVSSHYAKLMSEEEKIVAGPELPASSAKSISLDPQKIVIPDKNLLEEFRNSCSSTQSFQFPLLEVGGNSIKGSENMHSLKCKGFNEHVEQQRGTPQAWPEPEPEPEPQPRTSSIRPKRSTWVSFFSCCSAAN